MERVVTVEEEGREEEVEESEEVERREDEDGRVPGGVAEAGIEKGEEWGGGGGGGGREGAGIKRLRR